MDEIIIGFSKPKSWLSPFSWLIRLATWSKFSHAYVRYYNKDLDRWIIFQASGLKVNLIGQTMFDDAEDVYEEYSIPISCDTKQSVLQNAIDKLGAPYGIWQIFGFALVLLVGVFGKSIKNPFYSGSSYFCSELVADILMEISLGNLDSSNMSPKDIRNFLVSKGLKPIN